MSQTSDFAKSGKNLRFLFKKINHTDFIPVGIIKPPALFAGGVNGLDSINLIPFSFCE